MKLSNIKQLIRSLFPGRELENSDEQIQEAIDIIQEAERQPATSSHEDKLLFSRKNYKKNAERESDDEELLFNHPSPYPEPIQELGSDHDNKSVSSVTHRSDSTKSPQSFGNSSGNVEESDSDYIPSSQGDHSAPNLLNRSNLKRDPLDRIINKLPEYQHYIDNYCGVSINTRSDGVLEVNSELFDLESRRKLDVIEIFNRPGIPGAGGSQLRHVTPFSFAEEIIRNAVEFTKNQFPIESHKPHISAGYQSASDNEESETESELSFGVKRGASSDEHRSEKGINDAVSTSTNPGERIMKYYFNHIDPLVELNDEGTVMKMEEILGSNQTGLSVLSQGEEADKTRFNAFQNSKDALLVSEIKRLNKDLMQVISKQKSDDVLIGPEIYNSLSSTTVKTGINNGMTKQNFESFDQNTKKEIVNYMAYKIIDRRGILIKDNLETSSFHIDISAEEKIEREKRLKQWKSDKKSIIIQNIFDKFSPYIKKEPMSGAALLARMLLTEFNINPHAAFPDEGNTRNYEARVYKKTEKKSEVFYIAVKDNDELQEARSRIVGDKEERLVNAEGFSTNKILKELRSANNTNPTNEIAELLFDAFDFKKLEDKVLFLDASKKLVEMDGRILRNKEVNQITKSKKKYPNVTFRSETNEGEYDQLLPKQMIRHLNISFLAFPNIGKEEVVNAFINLVADNYQLTSEKTIELKAIVTLPIKLELSLDNESDSTISMTQDSSVEAKKSNIRKRDESNEKNPKSPYSQYLSGGEEMSQVSKQAKLDNNSSSSAMEVGGFIAASAISNTGSELGKRPRESEDSTKSNQQDNNLPASFSVNPDSSNLTRSEKSSIDYKPKPKFMDMLLEGLPSEQKNRIINMKEELLDPIPLKPDQEIKSIKQTSVPQVTLMAEDSHRTDHRGNVAKLSDMIENGQVNTNTVICLERKEQGSNFGMSDVRLLAKILEHNQNNQEDPISISETIQRSLIYQDALLYNKAKASGIEVVGVEGKNLAHNKESPLYNETREENMVKAIEQIVSSGKEVIFPVGSAHIENISSKLSANNINVLIDLDVSKANEEKRKYSAILKENHFKKSEFAITLVDNDPHIKIPNSVINKTHPTQELGL